MTIMFIYSLRANTLKFFGTVTVALAALIALIAFVPSYEPVPVSAPGGEAAASATSEYSYTKIKTNEDRVKFLEQFGWEVDPTATEEAEVVIPEEFDKVFTGYNEIQKKQGFDLSKYRRKKVMRYTYTVKNYKDYPGVVYANVIIKGHRVIGGDICSAEADGFIHGFEMSK